VWLPAFAGRMRAAFDRLPAALKPFEACRPHLHGPPVTRSFSGSSAGSSTRSSDSPLPCTHRTGTAREGSAELRLATVTVR